MNIIFRNLQRTSCNILNNLDPHLMVKFDNPIPNSIQEENSITKFKHKLLSLLIIEAYYNTKAVL